MRAVVWAAYGGPEALELRELAQPRPGRREVLIRVHATTVLAGDCELRRADFPPFYGPPLRLFLGVRRPRARVLGQELSGVVEAVGEGVTRFAPGDAVFGLTGLRMGAWADFACLPESSPLAPKPPGLSHAEAAAIPVGGGNALHFLRRAGPLAGRTLLVAGSTGSIGSFAVQLGRHLGAEVTAVCGTRHLGLVRELGAAHAIDFQTEDFAETPRGPRAYDVVFETIGKASLRRCLAVLKPGGCLLLATPSARGMLRGLVPRLRGGGRIVTELAKTDAAGLEELARLAASGAIRSVLDRSWPLEEMAEAHRYVEAGEKTGSVVIEVASEPV